MSASCIALAFILFIVASRWIVLLLLRKYGGERRISSAELLAKARGRTILIGERHDDRDGLYATLALMRAADAAGYRALGVEICEDSDGECSGLREELETLALLGRGELSENDARSSLDPGPDGRRPRMNRLWQMRVALALEWTIVPIDPHHWNWRAETAEGYLHSREPAMAAAIRANGPMLAVCGYGHMQGLHRLLGEDAISAVASAVRRRDAPEDFWTERIAFAATLPRLEEAAV